jgi:hypothetical protein
VKTAKEIFEELGAWLMAAAFIFLIFRFVNFMTINIEAEKSNDNVSYHARIDLRPLQHDFKSDSAQIKPVILK